MLWVNYSKPTIMLSQWFQFSFCAVSLWRWHCMFSAVVKLSAVNAPLTALSAYTAVVGWTRRLCEIAQYLKLRIIFSFLTAALHPIWWIEDASLCHFCFSRICVILCRYARCKLIPGNTSWLSAYMARSIWALVSSELCEALILLKQCRWQRLGCPAWVRNYSKMSSS